MKLAIMQPYFFPYLGYFQMINAVDTFVLLDDVNFIKKGYIHRNAILQQGQPHRFILPVEGMSQNKLISEHSFLWDEKNRKKFLSTITQSYQKSPYFSQIFPFLQDIFSYPNSDVTSLIAYSFQQVSEYLGMNTKFLRSSHITKDESKTGQARILELCNVLGADTYINAIGGQSLYEKEVFEKEKIALQFIQMRNTPYTQFGEEFVPYLSMIDVLMFCSIEEISGLLEEYDLK